MGLSCSVRYWFMLPGKIKKSDKGNSELKDDPYRQWWWLGKKNLVCPPFSPFGYNCLFLSNLDILGNNFPRSTFSYENLLRCFWVFHFDTQAANLCWSKRCNLGDNVKDNNGLYLELAYTAHAHSSTLAPSLYFQQMKGTYKTDTY